jgi:hypothetical protein
VISGVWLGQGEKKERNEEHGINNAGYYDHDNGVNQFVEKKMESLIMSLEVFCYQQDLSVKQIF